MGFAEMFGGNQGGIGGDPYASKSGSLFDSMFGRNLDAEGKGRRMMMGRALMSLGQGLASQQRGEHWASAATRGLGAVPGIIEDQEQRGRMEQYRGRLDELADRADANGDQDRADYYRAMAMAPTPGSMAALGAQRGAGAQAIEGNLAGIREGGKEARTTQTAGAGYTEERDERLLEADTMRATTGFRRQKELIGIQAGNALDQMEYGSELTEGQIRVQDELARGRQFDAFGQGLDTMRYGSGLRQDEMFYGSGLERERMGYGDELTRGQMGYGQELGELSADSAHIRTRDLRGLDQTFVDENREADFAVRKALMGDQYEHEIGMFGRRDAAGARSDKRRFAHEYGIIGENFKNREEAAYADQHRRWLDKGFEAGMDESPYGERVRRRGAEAQLQEDMRKERVMRYQHDLGQIAADNDVGRRKLTMDHAAGIEDQRERTAFHYDVMLADANARTKTSGGNPYGMKADQWSKYNRRLRERAEIVSFMQEHGKTEEDMRGIVARANNDQMMFDLDEGEQYIASIWPTAVQQAAGEPGYIYNAWRDSVTGVVE